MVTDKFRDKFKKLENEYNIYNLIKNPYDPLNHIFDADLGIEEKLMSKAGFRFVSYRVRKRILCEHCGGVECNDYVADYRWNTCYKDSGDDVFKSIEECESAILGWTDNPIIYYEIKGTKQYLEELWARYKPHNNVTAIEVIKNTVNFYDYELPVNNKVKLKAFKTKT